MKKFHLKLYKKYRWYAFLIKRLKSIILPGFGGVPLYYIINFFISELLNEAISIRASAIAFNFFLALIPGLIFMFTLIPYLPFKGVYQEIVLFFEAVLPHNTNEYVISIVDDVFNTKRGGLLSIGVFFALFFATNGISSLMDAFNRIDNRPYWKIKLISLALTIAFSLLLIVGFSMIVIGKFILDFVYTNYYISTGMYNFIITLRWVIVFIFVIISIITLYFHSSYPKRNLKLYLPGSLLASILSVLATFGFAYYVDNIAQYSRFYGSLGTIIIILLWFYFQSLVLIIGYELNHSILLGRKAMENYDFLPDEKKKISKL